MGGLSIDGNKAETAGGNTDGFRIRADPDHKSLPLYPPAILGCTFLIFVDTAIVFVDNRRAFKSLHFGVCKTLTEVDFDLGQGAFADCCAAPGN